MSHSEILAELPRLSSEERRQIIVKLCELQEHDMLTGSGPSEAEKRLLDQEMVDYDIDKNAGKPWGEAIAELQARRAI